MHLPLRCHGRRLKKGVGFVLFGVVICFFGIYHVYCSLPCQYHSQGIGWKDLFEETSHSHRRLYPETPSTKCVFDSFFYTLMSHCILVVTVPVFML